MCFYLNFSKTIDKHKQEIVPQGRKNAVKLRIKMDHPILDIS